jgi:uncharacterized surface protein with fasciclin (FAS1) repeats
MFKRFALPVLIVSAVGLTACNDSDDPLLQGSNTITAVAASDGRFDTLVSALRSTGLDLTLSGSGPFTVLAPTDDAFARLPAGLLGSVSTSDLAEILRYHVIAGDVREATVIGLDSALTEQGGSISIQFIDGVVVLNGRVQVQTTDIVTDNGVIHVIDAVLFPGDFPGTIVDALAASPRFDTLVGAVGGEGLAGTLGGTNGGAGFTVFAPTNDAFGRLPAGLVADLAGAGDLGTVLLYHVLGIQVDKAGAIAADGTTVPTLATDNGTTFGIAVALDADSDLFLDGRTQVVFTDIRASNGIIHVLDSVLVPGGNFPGTLVQALSAYPRFDSLVNAVVAEGLVGAVTNVTVFAPTNDAFAGANLGGQTLSTVLAYHLLSGAKDSGMLMATEPTLQGSTISIDTSAGVVINGSANVIRANIRTDDGIIHVIDAVLVP